MFEAAQTIKHWKKWNSPKDVLNTQDLEKWHVGELKANGAV